MDEHEAAFNNMMRRTKGAANPTDTPPSPSSFSVKFAANKNAELGDDYINISEDPVLIDKPNPPSTLSYKGGEFSTAPKAPRRKASPEDLAKVELISPPSPVLGGAPTEKSTSFRENFHNLKGRFSHRKNSEDEREKLLTLSHESVHSGTAGRDTKESPGIFGKIAKKVCLL